MMLSTYRSCSILMASLLLYQMPTLSLAAPPQEASSIELPLKATNTPHTLFLHEAIRTEFVPQQIFFLVAFDGDTFQRFEASITPPFSTQSDSEGKDAMPLALKEWHSGVQVPVPQGATRVSYAVLVAAQGEKFSLIPPRDLPVSDARFFQGSLEVLRASLLERKAHLQELQAIMDQHDDELRRLRADADVIADLSRIADVRDEVTRIRQLASGLKQDQENLREFVKVAKNSTPPRNYSSRERQLTKQAAALAELAKSTERGEFTRRNQSEQSLQHKLAVIDQARGLDLQALRDEWESIAASGVTEDTIPDTRASPPTRSSEGESPEDYLR